MQATMTSSPPRVVNSGQDAIVEQKLSAITEFSTEARKQPLVLETGERGSQLLDPASAVKVILDVKTRALKEFRDPRFVIVYRQLEKAFTTVGESGLEYQTTNGGLNAVTGTSFRKVLKRIAELVGNAAKQADARTTFVVHVDPAGATFELCPEYLTTDCIYVTADADARIEAVFRGRYTYRVSLPGFKTIEYPLDLVHFSQTWLDCRLQQRTASPCTPH